jgi:hypothetical protein
MMANKPNTPIAAMVLLFEVGRLGRGIGDSKR